MHVFTRCKGPNSAPIFFGHGDIAIYTYFHTLQIAAVSLIMCVCPRQRQRLRGSW